MNDPIAVWGDDNVIVEGHGRYLALRSIGEQGEVPCIRLDHLTDEQRRAYALAHNKLTMNSGFDFDVLDLEINDLTDFYDMSDFGFGIGESDDIGVSDDEFIQNTEITKQKGGKTMVCPHCGKSFEV